MRDSTQILVADQMAQALQAHYAATRIAVAADLFKQMAEYWLGFGREGASVDAEKMQRYAVIAVQSADFLLAELRKKI